MHYVNITSLSCKIRYFKKLNSFTYTLSHANYKLPPKFWICKKVNILIYIIPLRYLQKIALYSCVIRNLIGLQSSLYPQIFQCLTILLPNAASISVSNYCIYVAIFLHLKSNPSVPLIDNKRCTIGASIKKYVQEK